MMGDLADLFESVDGLTEDLMEYGTMAATAVVSGIAFNAGVNFLLSKWTTAPDWFGKYVVPGVAIVGGAAAGTYGSRYVGRRVGTGLAVGLMTAGAVRLIRSFAPDSVSQYLNGVDQELAVNGLGEQMLLGADNQFDRYLNGAPTSVEQVNGLGMSPVSVEQVSAAPVLPMGSFGRSAVGATFQ